MDPGRDWDEGVPSVLFVVREAVQDSLGFSPADLVFGHSVRGPLKMLKVDMLSSIFVAKGMHQTWSIASEALLNTQLKMKVALIPNRFCLSLKKAIR